jgi:hypothetical protein
MSFIPAGRRNAMAVVGGQLTEVGSQKAKLRIVLVKSLAQFLEGAQWSLFLR